MGKSMCSTPTESDSSPGTDAEISSDNILEKTIAHAFLKKNKMKNVLEEAMSNVLARIPILPSKSSDKVNGRRSLCWHFCISSTFISILCCIYLDPHDTISMYIFIYLFI